jgi:uncharacterized BrkB/YihY/UPF0761 family membrane protein
MPDLSSPFSTSAVGNIVCPSDSTKITPRSPHWYGVPVRVALLTFVGTLLSFAVILLFSILGTVIHAALFHVHPDMRTAYRHIAVPVALAIGCVILIVATVTEVRHYRQAKTLRAIERMG